MLLLLPLALIASSSALEVEVSTECSTCLLANTTCFNVSKLLDFKDLKAPFRSRIVIHKIGIQRSKNRLYYSFEPKIEDMEYFKVGFVDLDNHNVTGIFEAQDMILNFGTFDVDQDNEVIYLGGSNGVFALDTKSNNLSPYSSRGDSIESLFYKNNIYFSKYNDLGIVSKRGDDFLTLLDRLPVQNFVINKYDVIVFYNRYGLHVAKGDLVYRLSTNAFFRGVAKDLDENIYAWWIDGIYKVVIDRNLHYSKLVKHIDLEYVETVTFDNDNNILFTADGGLYRMTPTDTGCLQKPPEDNYVD